MINLLEKLHNADVERTILGVCLAFPERIPIASQAVADDWFGEHRWRLMETLLEMHDGGAKINVLSVRDRLVATNRADGWNLALLSALTDGLPKSTNLPHYVDLLRTLADKRRLLHLAVNAPAETIIPMLTAEDAAEKMIDGIRDAIQGGVEDCTPMSYELVEKAMEPPDQHDLAPLGFPGLDAKLGNGLRRGDVLTIAARPSHGKTAIGLAITANLMVHETRVCFVSMEMGAPSLTQRLISARAGSKLSNIRIGEASPGTYAAAGQITDWPLDILERASTVASIQRHLLRKPDTRVVIVDYVQLMDAGQQASRYGSRVQEIATISRQLKLLSADYGISLLLLCQLNRQVEQRGDQRPRLSDLRESGSLEQDSDAVLALYRPALSPGALDDPTKEKCESWRLNTKLLKNRQGPIGDVTLRFETHSQRIFELAEDAEEESGADTGDAEPPSADNW